MDNFTLLHSGNRYNMLDAGDCVRVLNQIDANQQRSAINDQSQLCYALMSIIAILRDRLKNPDNKPGFVIMAKCCDGEGDTSAPLFWSNDDGWVALLDATVFTQEEYDSDRVILPHGSWGWVQLP